MLSLFVDGKTRAKMEHQFHISQRGRNHFSPWPNPSSSEHWSFILCHRFCVSPQQPRTIVLPLQQGPKCKQLDRISSTMERYSICTVSECREGGQTIRVMWIKYFQCFSVHSTKIIYSLHFGRWVRCWFYRFEESDLVPRGINIRWLVRWR